MAEKEYIRLDRAFFHTRLWTESRMYSRAEAWLDLIQMARFENTTEIITNRELEVGRGEIPASRRFLEIRWKWSNTKVENFLKHLQKHQHITLRYANGQTVINVCNYDEYNPGRLKSDLHEPYREASPERRQNACGTFKINGEAACDSITQKGEKCGMAAKLNIGGKNYCRRHAKLELQNLGIIRPGEGDEKFTLEFAPEEFRPLISDWLSYKKARNQCYKTQQSVRLFCKQLMDLSQGKVETARGIIEKSMANNWAGIFEFKTNNYGTGKQDDKQDFGTSGKNYKTKSSLI